MAMDNATAFEVVGEALRVGHIILMSQEDVGHSAQSLQLSYQRHDELGRVDQPITAWFSNEIAVAAVRFRRVVSTVIDRSLDLERKILHDRLDIVVAQAADGTGGTGQERLQGLSPLGGRPRLRLHERRLLGISKDRR